jgi:hypothetical protein
MRRFLRVLTGLILIPLAGLDPTSAQETGDRGSRQNSGFELRQNYPNPFNPETRIPFSLGEELFSDGEPVVVTIRIYNVLQQLVASPTALNNPGGDGFPVADMEYETPGDYEAYWDGRDDAGNQVASGIYILELVVNGESRVRKMFVTK